MSSKFWNFITIPMHSRSLTENRFMKKLELDYFYIGLKKSKYLVNVVEIVV